MNTWMDVYREKLLACMLKHKEAYGTQNMTDVEIEVHAKKVADKMQAAFQTGGYNNDSHAIRATCRVFGIKSTYKSINAFIQENN